MIEVNLLPDIKQEYIKAEKSRKLVMTVAVLAIIVSVALVVLLYMAGALQRKHISDLNKDIDTYSKELKAKPRIARILTVQNQLESLTSLHNSKPAVSRLFEDLNQATPTTVDISSFKADFAGKTISITGDADSLSAVNKYIDSLKFTKYSTDNGQNESLAFSDIVLMNFGVGSAAANTRPANYTITLNYDPVIFDITQNPKLIIPKTTSTRSNTFGADELFKGTPNSKQQ